MLKFLNFFLMNLLLLSGRHNFDACFLHYMPVDNAHLESENLELDLENSDNKPRDHEENGALENYLKAKRMSSSEEGFSKSYPSFSWYNFQKVLPPSKFEVVYADPAYSKSSEANLNLKNGENEIKKKTSLEAFGRELVNGHMETRETGQELLSGLFARKKRRYLDYSNSQMPFNEGQLRRKPDAARKPMFSGAIQREQNARINRNIDERKYLKNFLKLQEKIFEVPGDDAAALEYSRVRRFLDQKRPTNGIIDSSTLEAKEAAMSRVLDPNLNLDGILEPHVRRRRGWSTKKRDLSLTTRLKNQRKLEEPSNAVKTYLNE